MITIYTDGGCRNNQSRENIGGWAYIILLNNEIIKEGSGIETNTSNNRMEMVSIIEALRNYPEYLGKKLTIYTDSAYVHNCFKDKWFEKWKNWKNSSGEKIKNTDLWKRLISFNERYTIDWQKVEAHSGNQLNDYVDKTLNNILDRHMKNLGTF